MTDRADFAEVLADFASGLDAATLPPEIVAAAQRNLLDTLACGIAGSTAAAIPELHELVREWGGAGQATVIAFGDRVPAHHAALINGAMCHARDYDDTHDEGTLHAGVSVVPAALAAAELSGTATGADLVAAVAAGLETMSRLGVATRIGIIESGFIYTALFGYFGATVAASRAFGLDVATTREAIGIVYSQVAGNHQVTRDGALTKRIQPGFAAMSALTAVQLARKGIRGARNVFDGKDGFLRVYLRDRYDSDRLRGELGSRYEFAGLSYKPYPCCRFNHTAIEAALDLRREHGITSGRIARIDVGVNRQAFEAVCTPLPVRQRPTTVVEAQFSLPYTVACAIIDGRVGLDHFAPERVTDGALSELASRVMPSVSDDFERDWGRSISPSRLRVELVDGGVIEKTVERPKGSAANPMTRDEVAAKLRDCFSAAEGFGPAAPQTLETAVAALPPAAGVRDLLGTLVAPRPV